ncbi:MAG: DinB family protein [Acidimicrobiales bacterium]
MADTKDWTWVLEQRCPECGFDATDLAREQIGSTTRRVVVRFEGFLDAGDVRIRPAPDVWSTLEYACHVRDVGRIFGERLRLMLDEDGPQFPNWDQDETALVDRYDQQDPAVVAVELAASGLALADAYDAVRPDQWSRTGYRSNGSAFTVESLGRYMVHDLVHHVWDIEQAHPA